MSVTKLWDALIEFKKIANSTKSIRAEFQAWGDRKIQFLVKGGEDCYISIQAGRMSLEKGKIENPDLTFSALDGHLISLITGQTDYTSLDILGSITFQGKEQDKSKFIAIIGLFISALLGESDEFEEND